MCAADSPAPQTGPSGTRIPSVIIIRSWPKIVMMVPTLALSLICGVVMAVWGDRAAPAEFSPIHYAGLAFLLMLAVNLTMLLYDLNLRGFIIVALLIVSVVLVLFLLEQRQWAVWRSLAGIFGVRVFANSAFYFMFALVLLFNLLIAWVITRFNFWKIEHNEIIIHKGFMHEQERHPTAQARFKLVIEDVVEYALMGSGTLVFYFGDSKTEHRLPTVLFVHRKARMLDEILGRLAVIDTRAG